MKVCHVKVSQFFEEKHRFLKAKKGVKCMKSSVFEVSSQRRSNVFEKKTSVFVKQKGVRCMKQYWDLQIHSKSQSIFF